MYPFIVSVDDQGRQPQGKCCEAVVECAPGERMCGYEYFIHRVDGLNELRRRYLRNANQAEQMGPGNYGPVLRVLKGTLTRT